VSKAYDGDIQLDASKNPMRIAAELIQWAMSQGERGHVRTNAWDYSTAFAFALGFRSKASGVGIALGLTLLAGSMAVLQLWVPGRNSAIIDAVVSSLGGLLGITLGGLLLDLATQAYKKHRHLGESAQAESAPPY
jgi:MFS family permease